MAMRRVKHDQHLCNRLAHCRHRRLRLEPLETRRLLNAGRLYVDADSTAAEPDGTAWSAAYVDLQDALDQAATLNADVDETNDISAIWIADGLYTPTKDKHNNATPDDPRTATFSMLSGVSLYGAFAGDEEALDDRPQTPDGSWTHETILSGDLAGDDVPDDYASHQENAYTVVYASDLSDRLTLDALAITAGMAHGPNDDSNPEWWDGAGVYARSSDISVTNSMLSGNRAHTGGGIYNNSGTLTVTNSTLSGNDGGGIYNTGTLTVTNSTLSGNRGGEERGGGIYNSGTLTVANSTLSGNSGARGGGGGIYNSGTLTISGSTLSENSACSGGGIFNSGTLTVTGSTFRQNWLPCFDFGGWGGGIFNSGTLTVSGSTLSGNSAGTEGSGGGIYNTGTLTVTDSTLSGNEAGWRGGGIYNGYEFDEQEGGPLTLINSTISGNSARDGGGIYNDDRQEAGLLTAHNTIVAGNVASEEGPDVYGAIIGTSSHNLIGDGSGMSGIVHGGNGNLVGTAATVIDPRFVREPSDGGDGWGDDPDTPDIDEGANDDYGDLRLTAESPAIDAGDDALVPEDVLVDLDGNPRIWNGTVDMGAYEYLDTALLHPGDANFDGVTDLSDFNIWNANKFVGGTTWATGDFNGDGVTDLSDFNIWNAYKFTSAGGETGLPVFDAAVYVQAAGVDVLVDNYSVPSLADFNGDGLADLIVGEKTDMGQGKVRVHINSGTAAEPVFGAGFYAQSGGADLATPGAGCLGVFPRLFDWDGDGLVDLMLGLAGGKVQVALNQNTAEQPDFATPEYVAFGPEGAKTDINVNARATLDVVDWNNDGRYDLLVGGYDGQVRLFLNEADSGPADFREQLLVQDGDGPLDAQQSRASVAVFDLDRDGKKDLILGDTDGQMLFFANIGTDAQPQFDGHELLEADGTPIDLPGTPRSRPFVGDYNADGIPDLLIGAADGLVQLYLGRSNAGDTADPPPQRQNPARAAVDLLLASYWE